MIAKVISIFPNSGSLGDKGTLNHFREPRKQKVVSTKILFCTLKNNQNMISRIMATLRTSLSSG